MKRRFLQDISASTIQVVLNQVLGLAVFILTSRYLSKPVYGEFNWSLAILTFVTTILSLRLEQVIVRKVASGENPSTLLGIFAAHTLFFGLFFYLLLYSACLIFPSFFHQHDLLLIAAISQLLLFFASPFKQLANGQEHFRLLAIMSTVSNLVRAAGLLLLLLLNSFGIQQVLIIYIVAALAELVICIYAVRFRMGIRISRGWVIKDYLLLLRESWPQIGSVFLNAAVARFDWILLGIFSTSVITAEYSFAYKVFELCPLPMLILAPVLLSRFSGYFSRHSEDSLLQNRKELSFFIRYAMIAATLLPLLLNIAWTPLMDAITGNKYGEVNKLSFFILSLCLPFQYMINLLWTVEFAQNRLKKILQITAVSCIVIVAGDLLMIPLMNAKGAALVYLLATMLEFGLYLRSSVISKIKESWISVALCTGSALLSGVAAERLTEPVHMRLAIALCIYSGLLILTSQVKWNDWRLIKEWAH